MTLFKDRMEAARALAVRLKSYRGRHPLVLGIPRGAVPMAGEIARSLGGELDVVLAHKIPAPGYAEAALGAISERGQVFLDPELSLMRLPSGYLQEELLRQSAGLRDRRAMYAMVHESVSPEGRVVIVVDDGSATGATTIAAVREVRTRKPREIVVALAVAPESVVRQLEKEADRVVSLLQPPNMRCVADFFEEFAQVSDQDVIGILAGSRTRSISSGT